MPKHRLSKITTRTGDAGESGLASGRRLAKSDVLFEAMGDVDELNAAIGLLMAALSLEVTDKKSKNTSVSGLSAWHDFCTQTQQTLFNVGGELAMDGGAQFITEQDVQYLDGWIAENNAALPELKEFVMPSGSEAIARCHLVRVIARRAERHTVRLHENTPQSLYLLMYLNRLSDAFFVMARLLAKQNGTKEVMWNTSS